MGCCISYLFYDSIHLFHSFRHAMIVVRILLLCQRPLSRHKVHGLALHHMLGLGMCTFKCSFDKVLSQGLYRTAECPLTKLH